MCFFSVSLITLFLGISSASAQTIWMQFAPVSVTLNATDDFLVPLTVGSNEQVVVLVPSLSQSKTFVISPKACTPSGQKLPKDECVVYRGGAFDDSASSSFVSGKEEYNYRNKLYGTYSNGLLVKDNIYLGGSDGKLEVEDYEFALIESSNMTSGMLGLGKNSTILQRLYDEGKIGSKSFGLHVGVDIWNHPWPVLNPTFDESGDKPTTEDDFNSGVGKRTTRTQRNAARQETEDNKLPVRDSHKFPGSLTLGGYDRSKISNKTKPIEVPIAEDGTFQLSLTKIVARNRLPNSPFDIMEAVPRLNEKPLKVVIDPDTPHMYFPQNISRTIGNIFSSVYGEPGYDFFYTYSEDSERYLGNLTMTLKAPDGKGDEIEILIPPTVWYQPVGYMRNFSLMGHDYYNYYAPMKEWNDGDETIYPIILGRSFLKAAHLFVNYDTNNFQIAQAAFTNQTQDIIAFKAGEDPPRDISTSDKNGSGNGGSKSGNSSPKEDEDDDQELTIPMPVLLGAGGAGVVLIAVLVFLIVCLKKRRNREKTKQHQQIEDRPNTGSSDLPTGGRTELDTENVAMVKLTGRPATAVSNVSSTFDGTHIELPEKGTNPITSELPAVGIYGKTEIGTNPYQELNAQHGYHEMPTNAIVLPTTPHKSSTPLSPNPNQYPPPPPPPPPQAQPSPITMPAAPGFPGYNYQQYPPPPGPPPATLQQYPPPSALLPVTTMYPAGYVPPPPPPNPPPPGSPYTYVPHQYPGQVHTRINPDPHARASLHEMA